jgi:hypothetical protein
MAIVWCHKGTRKTSLLGSGLLGSGSFIAKTKFDLIERDFWTNLDSLGELVTIHHHGIRNMKNWSSLNERMAIVSCQEKGARKTRLWRGGLRGSGEDMPITKCNKIKRNFWTNSSSFGTWGITHGIYIIKSWLHLNDNTDIVWRHSCTRKTYLFITGLAYRGQTIHATKCERTERNFWTNSVSAGKLTPLLQPALLPRM